MKKRIFLSVPGLICCAGKDRNELHNSCLSGYQGGFDLRELPGGGSFPTGRIPPELLDNSGGTRIIRIIDKALEQLGPQIESAISAYGPEKIGVCLGSCDNGSEASLAAHQALLEKGAFPKDYSLGFQSAAFPSEYIARKFGLSGPVFTVATACASGASAIIRGAELIQAGICSAVIAGGADIVSETVLAGFHSLEALSDKLCNPFSKNRKGINLGEGAAFFLLGTEENSAVELLGAGESADAFHMTAPGTDGAGPAKAMTEALFCAGLKPGQVGYVNLHGTGTVLNDRAEAMAMKMVFKSSLPPASSTKPITGHTLGAAGALEAAICWMVLTEKRGLPVHCWDGAEDRELSYVPGPAEKPKNPYVQPAEAPPSICMSNSFAFGGCNVSLILGRRAND